MKGSRAILILALILKVGCSSPEPPPADTHGEWKALQSLQMDTLMMIGPDASMGNWAAVKRHAASDAFQKGVDEFANSELPASMSDQEGNKTKAVDGLRQLIAASKSGGGSDDMKAAWDKLQEALKELNSASVSTKK